MLPGTGDIPAFTWKMADTVVAEFRTADWEKCDLEVKGVYTVRPNDPNCVLITRSEVSQTCFFGATAAVECDQVIEHQPS